MKRFKMLSALALGCLLAGSLCVLTGCGPKEDEPGDPDAAVLNFVATDGTNWDASVTIAQKTYNLSMDLNADKTLELVGTCTGEAQQGDLYDVQGGHVQRLHRLRQAARAPAGEQAADQYRCVRKTFGAEKDPGKTHEQQRSRPRQCAAGKAAADPERFSGTAPRSPRFRSVLFCLSVRACAWLRRPSAKREGDGAASAAPSASPPTCL